MPIRPSERIERKFRRAVKWASRRYRSRNACVPIAAPARHWSLARATMSACVSFASARALRAPRVSQRRPARKVRFPASRARDARALIPADVHRRHMRCDVFGARAQALTPPRPDRRPPVVPSASDRRRRSARSPRPPTSRRRRALSCAPRSPPSPRPSARPVRKSRRWPRPRTR